jgi:hypothetical protein
MQMSEVMTLLTSVSGHALVKRFIGTDLTLRPFSTGKLFNVSEEPVSDLKSLSALNTPDRSRRILFYEMMAADAFPIMGSMTMWDGIKDYNTRMLCGEPTIKPRLKDIPIRIPQPQPDVPISIYEIQKGLKARAFKTIK